MLQKIRTATAGLGTAFKSYLPSSASLARVMPVVLLAVAMTAMAMMWMWRQDAAYKPLFGAYEDIPVAEALAALDGESIPYRLHPQSGQILVPEHRMGVARMMLAARGVAARLPEGLEQVDRGDPLGVSQFVQDVRFRRGLEGELTRSIASLEPVESARVHLSIVRSSSFILDDGDKSSASVVVKLRQGRKLRPAQVEAIVALVSGSVANLDRARVAVVDQTGQHLSHEHDAASLADSEQGARTRDEILQNIQSLLGPSVGEGQFRAGVTVAWDTDHVEETRETYGDKPLVTQEATREESDKGQMAVGVPGSLSNRAPTASKNPADKPDDGPQSQRQAVTRQYVYDRNVVQIKRAPARIQRVNVAVVLNNAAAPDGKSWTPEQLSRIESILRHGIGIDGKREDGLVVSALDFHTSESEEVPPWWQQPDRVASLGGYAGFGIAALVVLLLVVRPLLSILRQWVGQQVPRKEAAVPEVGDGELAEADAPEELPDVPLPPVGSSVDVMVEHLKVLANQAPERVVDVIKPWISKHGQ